jgi:hypothetical protein
MIVGRMGRSHGPREPRRHRPAWQPEPLGIPLEHPVGPRSRRPSRSSVEIGESDEVCDDRAGTHVIVIDIA